MFITREQATDGASLDLTAFDVVVFSSGSGSARGAIMSANMGGAAAGMSASVQGPIARVHISREAWEFSAALWPPTPSDRRVGGYLAGG